MQMIAKFELEMESGEFDLVVKSVKTFFETIEGSCKCPDGFADWIETLKISYSLDKIRNDTDCHAASDEYEIVLKDMVDFIASECPTCEIVGNFDLENDDFGSACFYFRISHGNVSWGKDDESGRNGYMSVILDEIGDLDDFVFSVFSGLDGKQIILAYEIINKNFSEWKIWPNPFEDGDADMGDPQIDDLVTLFSIAFDYNASDYFNLLEEVAAMVGIQVDYPEFVGFMVDELKRM